MSNLDKAADLIARYEAEPGEFNPRGLAQQLAEAGLLAEDHSPQPPTGLDPHLAGSGAQNAKTRC
ncbi:hypothetical protein NG01_04390 [Corynebacterium diphtheriae]|uniref:hypothetical protein n=1 Tax=Corynebacterium diphtheriae TaxID=1717 RepID=UPI0005EBEAE8|nr:hypothetical protein [Corynebacterium diphtheriae]KJJ60023.1 hypothetical protein NG01_04390 [Corynebacterium diphtheriae]